MFLPLTRQMLEHLSGGEAGLHRFGSWERELLEYAALLHHIGGFLTYNSYQKHSEYLIRNAELLGFDELETNILAMVVLFHRNGLPRKRDVALDALPARAREAVGRDAVAQARESRRIIRDRYEAGLTDVVSLTRSAEAVAQAEAQQIAAQVAVVTETAALQRALGRQ